MTTAVGLICTDGIAIGTDMKVTAGSLKWREAKLFTEISLGKRALFIAGAGRLRHVKDAIDWVTAGKLEEYLGDNPSFDEFIGKVIEVRLPQFAHDFQDKYGIAPSIELLVAGIDKDGKPRLAQIYNDGDYDHRDTFAAIGSGSIFGEILLRKLYYPEMTVSVAKKVIGYIIWEIQDIDNDSGEHMQIATVDNKGKATKLGDLEIESYKTLPMLVSNSYKALRRKIEAIQLEQIENHIKNLQELVSKVAQSEGHSGKANKGTTETPRPTKP